MISPRRLARYAVLGVVVLAWEGLVGPRLGPAGPDPVLAMLLVVALADGMLAGTVMGFVLGLLVDLGMPSLLGLHALVGTVTGFGTGRFAARLVIGLPVVEWSAGVVAALGYGLAVQLGRSWLQGGAFLRPLVTQVVPGAVLTGVLLVLLLRLLELLHLLDHEA